MPRPKYKTRKTHKLRLKTQKESLNKTHKTLTSINTDRYVLKEGRTENEQKREKTSDL